MKASVFFVDGEIIYRIYLHVCVLFVYDWSFVHKKTLLSLYQLVQFIGGVYLMLFRFFGPTI